MSENTIGKNIAAAFVKAQSGFAPALKTSTNPHFKSKYADLSACIEAVIDSLNENGIGLMQKTSIHDGGVVVKTTFIHSSGETMDGGDIFVPVNKTDAQGFGSALTYARRYSVSAACGIAPEDDDGNAATAAAPKRVNKEPYPADRFEENLPTWGDMVAGGKKTPADIIKILESRATITDDQRMVIEGL